jgi:hypothetical protein
MTTTVQIEEIKEAWETIEGFVECMEDLEERNGKMTKDEKDTLRKLHMAMQEAYTIVEESKWAEESCA